MSDEQVMDLEARQARIIRELNVQPTVLTGSEIVRRTQFLKQYLLATGASGFVLGISGGQDSTLAGRLTQLAIQELREETGFQVSFTAMRLPYGTQADEADAQLALKFIEPDVSVVFDIKPAVDAFKGIYDGMQPVGMPLSDYTKGNTKARMRMSAQYAYAGEHNLLVVGTDHAAEAVTGFFTKFGDGGADVLPLSGLTKRQGRELLTVLGAPARLYEKAPTADLLDERAGQADEFELGLTYQQLDDFLEGHPVAPEVARLIIDRYDRTWHKRNLPVSPW